MVDLFLGFFFFFLMNFHTILVKNQLVQNPPAMQETWVRSLGQEEPLEKGKATHSTILAWRIPWTVCSWGHKELDTAERLSLHFHLTSVRCPLIGVLICVSLITSDVEHLFVDPRAVCMSFFGEMSVGIFV